MTRPTFTVVITTHNRAPLVCRAISSVLAQTFGDWELLVVDDGSTDETPDVLNALEDLRIHSVRQTNQGLSAARNAGVLASTGHWLTFLDDDDEAGPRWLALFAEHIRPDAGVICCGALLSTPARTSRIAPAQLGPLFGHRVGLFQAGTFCVRRDVFEEAGGYWVGLQCSHQTELALRVLEHCERKGLSVRTTEEAAVTIHQAAPTDRPMQNPVSLLSGVLAMLARHGSRLRRNDPATLADYLTIGGVNAIRLGRYGLGRSLLAQALRWRITEWRSWARLLASCVPPVARRIWPAPVTTDRLIATGSEDVS